MIRRSKALMKKWAFGLIAALSSSPLPPAPAVKRIVRAVITRPPRRDKPGKERPPRDNDRTPTDSDHDDVRRRIGGPFKP